MKRVTAFFAFLLAAVVTASGQIMDPVSWSGTARQTAPGKYILSARADIEYPWHIYSLVLPDGGPMPTEFAFQGAGELFTLDGKTSEPVPEKSYDANFQMEIQWHSGVPVFTQQITVKDASVKSVTAEVTYMACDDTQCLAPETKTIVFQLPVTPDKPQEKKPAVKPSEKPAQAVVETPAVKAAADNTASDAGKAELAVSKDGDKTNDTALEVQQDTAKGDSAAGKVVSDGKDGKKAGDGVVAAKTVAAAAETGTASRGLWGTFFFAFVAGLLALLTPCVFPMIPMTVSFFMKRSSDRSKGIRDAMLYGVSIVAIYLILGVGVSAIFGAAALNELSTDPWFNIFFFLLLVVFAASFFGAFELTLPSSWVNKMDKKSDKAGLVGIFFMAFTLAMVSFSCTGPFVGTVLVEAAAKGDFWGPIVGMLGFSSALALPFTLFAVFPSWLSGLPKSGGWLNSVKVVLGFVELAFALKFLSNADMVWDLMILTREVFIAIWVVIFLLLGFYLLGKIRLPHDSPLETVSVTRLFLSIISLSFAVYMLPGIWGSPVKIISAFAPPQYYSEAASSRSPEISLENMQSMSLREESGLPHREQGPQGIPVFTDMEDAKKYASARNMPMLLDFTGKACVNCRKMEADVWSDAKVNSMLTNDFVVVELYVDFRKELPEDQQYISASGKKIKTVGQKWTDYQITNYGSNSQPYYVITDAEGNAIAPTRAYDLDVSAYLRWLEEGLAAFKNIQATAAKEL